MTVARHVSSIDDFEHPGSAADIRRDSRLNRIGDNQIAQFDVRPLFGALRGRQLCS